MSKGKGLGLAAAVLFLLGIQIAAPAPAAAQDDPAPAAAAPAAEPSTDRSTYYERRTTARTGNIYGRHGVIGHVGVARHGGYYAARRAPRTYVHGSYRPRHGRAYYGATTRYPRYYARHNYPGRPLAPQYYGANTYAPQYYARRSYPVPAQPLAAAPQYYGSAANAPQYYGRRSYPAYPAGGTTFATNDPVSSLIGTATNWRAGCVNGRICTGGVYYRGSVPICRGWSACNY